MQLHIALVPAACTRALPPRTIFGRRETAACCSLRTRRAPEIGYALRIAKSQAARVCVQPARRRRVIFCVSRVVRLESERRRAGRREAAFACGGEREVGRVLRVGEARVRSRPVRGGERGRVARAHVVSGIARRHPAIGRARVGKRRGRNVRTTLPLRLRRRVLRVRRRGRLRRLTSFRVVRLFCVSVVRGFVVRRRRLSLRLVLMMCGGFVRRCRVVSVVVCVVYFAVLVVRCVLCQRDVAGDARALARLVRRQADAARH